VSRLATAAGALLVVSLAVAFPALAADRSAQSLLAERIALGVMLAGGLVFFAWVAWLAFRK
jgi:hypothetical protein